MKNCVWYQREGVHSAELGLLHLVARRPQLVQLGYSRRFLLLQELRDEDLALVGRTQDDFKHFENVQEELVLLWRVLGRNPNLLEVFVAEIT